MKFFNFQKLNHQQGFSLLEVLVSIFVITIGIVAVVNLVSSAIGSVAINKSEIIAVNLAQEGLEIVRNIRDTNWQQGESWNNGLSSGEYQVAYDSNTLFVYSGNPLLIDDIMYQYNSGDPTPFYRKIIIDTINEYSIEVTSQVTWGQRGRNFEVIAKTILYDWR